MRKLSVILFALTCSFSARAAVVEFHILKGTGSNPWNTLMNPIHVMVGDTLRLINDDTIPHLLHTDGSPCAHGTHDILPGGHDDMKITSKHNAGDEDLYDHNLGPDAQVYIQSN